MTPEDHELLAQTGPKSAMGQLLRRFWMPAVLSRELAADGSPVRVRLLSEDLVAFRNTAGKVGLLQEFCAHRGASLYLGCNEKNGLRCSFHGWKYDLEGRCVDMPNVAPNRSYAHNIRLTAYPCVERAGVVWAYMGPPEDQPELPGCEFMTVPDAQVTVTKRFQECNWMQGQDGDVDPSHVVFTHQSVIRGVLEHAGNSSTNWLMNDLAPVCEVQPIPAGLLMSSRWNVGESDYYRMIHQWLMPNITTLPAFAGDLPLVGHCWTPVDDGRLALYVFSWHPTRPLTQQELDNVATGRSSTHISLIPGTFTPLANKSNDYVRPGTPPASQPWMRVTGFQDQDLAMSESQGRMYDRTKEHLGPADLHIVQIRKALAIEARRLAAEGRLRPIRAGDYGWRGFATLLPRSTQKWWEALADPIRAAPETYRVSV
jgi:phenylpropionate dioxygenase-like ring-hydroxylating dioxygenase large terminal subunit